LEKECEQGKKLLNRAPQKAFHVQDFNPEGLYRSYRDSATGLELPLFGVFDLEGKHQLSFEITTDSISNAGEPGSLISYMPFQKTQVSLREIHKNRMTSEIALSRICIPLGIIPGLALFVFGLTFAPLTLSFGLVQYIRDLYSNNMIILWHDNWSDQTGAARAA
jgi:hypothetical protein